MTTLLEALGVIYVYSIVQIMHADSQADIAKQREPTSRLRTSITHVTVTSVYLGQVSSIRFFKQRGEDQCEHRWCDLQACCKKIARALLSQGQLKTMFSKREVVKQLIYLASRRQTREMLIPFSHLALYPRVILHVGNYVPNLPA